MSAEPDRRVRRTRRTLHNALLDLMTEKDYEAIKVQEIIDRADVGRSTFYTHFMGKQDLLRWGLADLRAGLKQPPPAGSDSTGPLFRFSLQMFAHVGEHRELALSWAGQTGRGEADEKFESLLADLVRDELAALTPANRDPDVPVELAVGFVVAAFFAALKWWVVHGFDDGPERADGMFHALVAPGVQSVFGLTYPARAVATRPLPPRRAAQPATGQH